MKVTYFAVRSDSNPSESYTVTRVAFGTENVKSVACTCPRFAKGGFVCKHMLRMDEGLELRAAEFELKSSGTGTRKS